MKSVPILLALFLAVAASPRASGESGSPERTFDLPASEMSDVIGDGALELSDVGVENGLPKRFAEKWPKDLVIAPVPGRSPQLGWNLVLGGGYFLSSKQAESDPRPSIIGGFGMISENGSYAYGAGASLHFLDDKLRVRIGAANADIRYQFYGIGNRENDLGIGVDILQKLPLYFAAAKWRIWNSLYLGLGYTGGKVNTRIRASLPDPNLVNPLGDLEIGAWMIPLEFDSRDHAQFPRQGWHINARAMLYRESAGSDFDAETYKVSINHYRPVGEQSVLAFRANIERAGGDAPFFLLSTFGGTTDLRGYPSGRYRDRSMYALQSEYRWLFSDRWIFTGFVGFGEVAEDFGGFGENYLPAAGIGARFVLSKKHRVGLSFDIAAGKDGTEYYFGVGEAF